ncbi:MAG: hypothetical protein GF353_10600 [Candidatus Lokiarchaeota archaeon]|nr:hypothetical protein [Candidatus Lokiarchaeota archaeon]
MVSESDKKLFFSEAEDLIQSIEDNVLALEENPSDNQPIQNLFFVYHTLKGMTAMVGLDRLSKFCHHFETFLDKHKNFKETVERKEEFINLLFESLDIIRGTINNARKGTFKDLSEQILNEITEAFEEFEIEYDVTFFNALPAKKLEDIKKDKSMNFYKIYIQIQATCVFKKVRLFIIFRALNDIGRICATNPDPSILEKGNFDESFELYYMSKKGKDDIENALDEILEIESKKISSINSDQFYKVISDFNRSFTLKEKVTAKIEPFQTDDVQEISAVSNIVTDFEDRVKKITSVKVDIEILEKLMDYFGELVIIKNQLSQMMQDRQDWEGTRFFDNMDKLFLDIQEIIFNLKLVRVDTTFRRYRRLVRDVARETDKQIRFTLEGLDVEIDRKVLEELNSPLIHLLRNAIYHGIETPVERQSSKKGITGNLALRTYRRAGSIYIEVEDDGKGLDFESIRRKVVRKELYTEEEAQELSEEELKKVIFQPGFSTLAGADEISGRGMGLAIVKDKIEELGGAIDISTEKGKGTTFSLDVPFTRAILKAQLMKIGGDLFAIPIENIKQIYFYKRELIEYVKGVEHYRIERTLVPVVRLGDYLDFVGTNEEVEKARSKVAIWCYKDEKESAMFIVDEILQQLEVVIKPFRSRFSEFQEILGVSITGDGSICLIIDVFNIITSLAKKLKGLKLTEIPQSITN